MDINIEESFIRAFCQERYVDRLLYELKSKKKRLDAIWRFNDVHKIFKQDLIIASGNKFSPEGMIEEIKKLSKSGVCYVLAPYDHANGILLPLEQGIMEGFYNGLVTVFIIDKDTAIIKVEQCYGSPMKYILHRST